jgi:bifunctional non-homologous end joining protein LigD
VKVIGAMQTPGGDWRVEVVRHQSGSRWYRLIHHDNVVDFLTIGRVAELLAQAGVDMSELAEVDAPSARAS